MKEFKNEQFQKFLEAVKAKKAADDKLKKEQAEKFNARIKEMIAQLKEKTTTENNEERE